MKCVIENEAKKKPYSSNQCFFIFCTVSPFLSVWFSRVLCIVVSYVLCHAQIVRTVFVDWPCIGAKINFNHSARWRASVWATSRSAIFLQFDKIFTVSDRFSFTHFHFLRAGHRSSLFLSDIPKLETTWYYWEPIDHFHVHYQAGKIQRNHIKNVLAQNQCANLIGRHFTPYAYTNIHKHALSRGWGWMESIISERWNNMRQIDGKIAYWRCMYVCGHGAPCIDCSEPSKNPH